MLFISAVIFVINGVSALSYNQPKLCPTASWNEVSRTFAHEKANVTRHPIQFIDTKNTIYTASEAERQIFIRHEGQTSSKSIGYLHNSSLSAIFVIDTDDIYTSYENRKIEKWIANKNEYVHIMDTESTCFDLFIDIENNLYCSMSLAHKVVKRQLNEAKTTIVAGVDTAGYESHQLNSPTGIFVDTNLDLYVADRMNNRIQLFHLGETDGKTIVGDDSSDITISLRGPYSIVLDSDKYFYIAEYDNRRIIASGPNGFRRLFKPSLNKCPRCSVVVHAPFGPTKVSFDVHGNLFVSDLDNRRIQIFDLQKDSCVSVPSIIQTTYSSVLTNEHPRFSRNLFHDFTYRYEAIEITVHETDFYILTASSSVDLYGHVYKDDFHRFDPSKNLIAWFGQCCRKDQFKFTLELQANTKYILVVTTYHPKVTGPFSIITYGSHPLNLRLMDVEPFIESIHSSQLTEKLPTYDPFCSSVPTFFYEAIQMNVIESGFYTIYIRSNRANTYSNIYKSNFYPSLPLLNLLMDWDAVENRHIDPVTVTLMNDTRYIYVMATSYKNQTTGFWMNIFGRSHVHFQPFNISPIIHSKYSSNLTVVNPTYNKWCVNRYYYYETVRLTIFTTAYYTFVGDVDQRIEMFIYKNQFNLWNPRENLVKYRALGCAILPQITLLAELQANTTYILLVTTMKPLETLSISITVSGPADVTFERFIDNSAYCHVGGLCERQVKGIGLTLDDILRLELKRNMTINDQPLVIKISAALTTIMLFVGVISSAFSLLTFQNGNLRTVGCGLYLLASSITSFLTITMFAIKFWFVVITQTNVSIDLSVLQGGCKSIETLLKLFFYWDAWLNACIAVERAVNVYKGVSFDKEKSKRFARWIIFILPNCISATVIHEPLYRHMFSYEDKEERFIDPWYKVPLDVNVISTDTWCTTSYSQSIENYNTVILFIHLLGPFIANFCCALFIIIRSARRRAEVQKQQSYRKHVREQWKEHKHLVISPMILLLLSTPRLIISLLSGCVNVTNHLWLYLCAYFISFLPSVLFFILFVIPSDLYRKTFKESFFRLCRRKRRSNQI
ncbi:unnamed protein product [Adineta ricciae]|uniref:Uncharacterized protein n=1 Tax=Adineta ricciae TaxID=249248 RepID=A0A815QBD2_ADIRI|nr:unnamed protein product [Adineta ricciae]